MRSQRHIREIRGAGGEVDSAGEAPPNIRVLRGAGTDEVPALLQVQGAPWVIGATATVAVSIDGGAAADVEYDLDEGSISRDNTAGFATAFAAKLNAVTGISASASGGVVSVLASTAGQTVDLTNPRPLGTGTGDVRAA